MDTRELPAAGTHDASLQSFRNPERARTGPLARLSAGLLAKGSAAALTLLALAGQGCILPGVHESTIPLEAAMLGEAHPPQTPTGPADSAAWKLTASTKLVPLSRVVVIPFYVRKVADFEVFAARALTGVGAGVHYPARAYTVFVHMPGPCGYKSAPDEPRCGMFVFAPGCWPTLAVAGGPSDGACALVDHSEDYKDVASKARVVLYSRVWPWDERIAAGSVRHMDFGFLCAFAARGLLAAVDETSLAPGDRDLVCRDLAELLQLDIRGDRMHPADAQAASALRDQLLQRLHRPAR